MDSVTNNLPSSVQPSSYLEDTSLPSSETSQHLGLSLDATTQEITASGNAVADTSVRTLNDKTNQKFLQSINSRPVGEGNELEKISVNKTITPPRSNATNSKGITHKILVFLGIKTPPPSFKSKCIAGYINRTNAARSSDEKEIRALKNFIKTSLNNPSSELFKALVKLPIADQLQLARALTMGSGKGIAQAFTALNIPISSQFSSVSLERLAEHKNARDPKCLNRTVTKLLLVLSANRSDGPRNFNQQISFNRNLMQSIPDQSLHPLIKRQILNQAYPRSLNPFQHFGQSISSGISDVCYSGATNVPIPPTARPQFTNAEKLRATDDYLTALTKPDLDQSEFIALSYGFLKASDHNGDDLKKIATLYDAQKYSECIDQLKIVLSNKPSLFEKVDQKQMDQALKKNTDLIQGSSLQTTAQVLVLKMADKATPMTARSNNNARRYYETRSGVYHLTRSTEGGVDIRAVGKIMSQQLGVSIRTPAEAEEAILTWSDAEHNTPRLAVREQNFKKQLPTYLTTKDRAFKQDNFSRVDTGKKNKESETILSGNAGLMKQTSPYFQDEVSEYPLINKPGDTVTQSYKEGTYSVLNPETPFSFSLSGHAVYVMMRVEDYMKSNQNSPTLSAEVNSILHATIAAYGKNGFHSAHEISDMFKEPAVQALFDKYGIALDLQLPDPIKEDGLIDAAKYTLAYARKQIIQEELKIYTSPEGC